MHHITTYTSSVRLWVGAGALCLLGLFVFASQAIASDDTINADARMVSIYDQGVEHTIITKAKTVRGALEQADVKVSSVDSIEPGLDQPLVDKHYHVNVYRARPVIVQDGATEIKTLTATQTASGITESAKVTIYPEDTTELVRVDGILEHGGAGLKLAIDRATVFTLVHYGTQLPQTRSQATTVGGMLKDKGIVLGAQDGVSVPLDTPLTDGMTVAVWRNGEQTSTQEEEVPMPVEQVKDQDREVGYKAVKTPGKPGKKQVTYKITMQNGVEVKREKISEVETVAPLKQVEVVGAKVTNTFSGSFAEALARLRSCEGSYTSNTGNGYYGAYQYDIQTWGGYMGYPNASVAPPEVQDQKVWETYQRRGWQPWPSCRIKMGLQDIYR